MMNWTIGIITDGTQEARLTKVLYSIADAAQYYDGMISVHIVGGSKDATINMNGVNVTWEPFDESIKQGWITKKKNAITDAAFHDDNIAYMHDYITLSSDWFNGWKNVEFDVGMCRIYNNDNTRFRDWCIWSDESHPRTFTVNEKWSNQTFHGQPCLAPYDLEAKSPYQFYVSGAFWVAKKHIMKKYPLDEDLVWGQGEDVEWSLRTLQNVNYIMNTEPYVKLMKQKDVCLPNYDQVYNL